MSRPLIRTAGLDDVADVTAMVLALTGEICRRCGVAHFDLDPAAVSGRCAEYLERGVYTVLIARSEDLRAIGFAALCESHALYAGGAFGIIQEFYVVPPWRGRGVGGRLVEESCIVARARDWVRLELCTPPLPEFERTLAFYRKQGFDVTGGRKMRRPLV